MGSDSRLSTLSFHAMQKKIYLLISLIILLSCEIGNDKDYPPEISTSPFTCNGNYQIKLEKSHLGTSFHYGNNHFFSISTNKILKYQSESLTLIEERILPNTNPFSKFVFRDNQSGWLFSNTDPFGLNGKGLIRLIDSLAIPLLTIEVKDELDRWLPSTISSTNNGGFVLALPVNNGYKIYNYSDQGILIWEKYLDGFSRVEKILHLSTDQFLIGGSNRVINPIVETYRSYLLKLDGQGNQVWFKEGKNIPYSDRAGVFEILEDVSSGDYIVITPGVYQPLKFVRTDSSYNKKWSIEIGEKNQYNPYRDVDILRNGADIIVSYSSGTTIMATSDIHLASVTTDGLINWERTYGGTGDEHVFSLIQINSGYIIVGRTINWDGNISKAPTTNGYLIKTDFDGNSCK